MTKYLSIVAKDRTSASEFNSPAATPLRGQLSKTQSVPSMASPCVESEFSPDDIPSAKSVSCDLGLTGQKLLWRATPKPLNTDQVTDLLLLFH